MSKEVTMTFRVEEDLRARFTKAAEREHRPAAQVLREFMREYVSRARAAGRKGAPLADDERRRREQAVRTAWASVNLEGFTISDEERLHAQRFIDGEIELDEFVRFRDDSRRA